VSGSMTSDERVRAAVCLERPDRTPVIPSLLPEPAAALAGVSQAEIARDNAAAVSAVFRVFDDYGGWDNPYPASYTPVQLQVSGVFPMKMKIPGHELADDVPYQLDEEEILQPSDYDRIAEQGFARFFREDYLGRISRLSPEAVERELSRMASGGALFLAECARRGVRPLFLANALHPFFTLSLMRSLTAFTKDLYFEPEPVLRALERMTDDLVPQIVGFAKQTGIDIALLTEERASGFFLPPRFCERFWWPYTQRIVEALWCEGVVTLFHLDTCWDQNLAGFRRLPRGSAILELDGTSDLLAAGRVLGGHLCLKGDVPAALLSVGSAEDVERYCARLVDAVGRDGGFILSSGCSVPPTTRPENLRAMLETARRMPLGRA